MSTEAQITANIANAEQSTGPQTEAGKAKVRTNAIRHGLCSAVGVISGEDHTEFELLRADLREEHQPEGPTEDILIFKMAAHFFASCRADVLLAHHLNINNNVDNSKQVALMLRYQTSADRGFNKNLADLLKLQKKRRDDLLAQPVSDPIGFVPQNAEAAQPAPIVPAAEPPQTAPTTPKISDEAAPITREVLEDPSKKAA